MLEIGVQQPLGFNEVVENPRHISSGWTEQLNTVQQVAASGIAIEIRQIGIGGNPSHGLLYVFPP